ncbi:MAG: DUF6261 family protein [Bacteroidales bacterium]|jgi:hypothetical protein|nr:DUF6261 family protein [Bacteroidales bacterium]
MKIKNIKLGDLRNDEHFQLMQFVLELAEKTGAGALHIETPVAALANAHRREHEAFRKIMKSALTAEIYKADRARNTMFRGMVNAVNSALMHFNHQVREAAMKVEIVLNAYGNVVKKSNIEKTGAVHNLLHELNTNHAGSCQTLGVAVWTDELGRLNQTVETLIARRADEGAVRTPLVLKTVRTETDAAYRTLTATVSALAVTDRLSGGREAGLYQEFISRLNERIDTTGNALSIRRGLAAAARKKEKQEADDAGVDVKTFRKMKKYTEKLIIDN